MWWWLLSACGAIDAGEPVKPVETVVPGVLGEGAVRRAVVVEARLSPPWSVPASPPTSVHEVDPALLAALPSLLVDVAHPWFGPVADRALTDPGWAALLTAASATEAGCEALRGRDEALCPRPEVSVDPEVLNRPLGSLLDGQVAPQALIEAFPKHRRAITDALVQCAGEPAPLGPACFVAWAALDRPAALAHEPSEPEVARLQGELRGAPSLEALDAALTRAGLTPPPPSALGATAAERLRAAGHAASPPDAPPHVIAAVTAHRLGLEGVAFTSISDADTGRALLYGWAPHRRHRALLDNAVGLDLHPLLGLLNHLADAQGAPRRAALVLDTHGDALIVVGPEAGLDALVSAGLLTLAPEPEREPLRDDWSEE